MQNKVDTAIDEVMILIDEWQARLSACESVMGMTQSNPGAGEPCGCRGSYRSDIGLVLCDRCNQAVARG